GFRWEYENNQSNKIGKLPGARSVERVTEVHSAGENIVATIVAEYDYSKGAGNQRRAVVTPLGVSPDPTPMTTSSGTVMATRVKGYYLPRELLPGKRWTYSLALDTPLQSSELEATVEVASAGMVVVPAGEFEVLRVLSTQQNHMLPKRQPGS